MLRYKLKDYVFDTYHKARLVFAQEMAELATRSSNVKYLVSAGVLESLRPLLSDSCSSVRQCAVDAAARLAEHDDGVARQILNNGMFSIILHNLDKYNVYYKRSALYLVRAVAKHNEELSLLIIRLGALELIVSCLQDFDTQVKENAAWALGYIGQHSENLAGQVVDAGTLPLLVLVFQEPELSLKQITADALVELARFKPEAVVNAGAISHIVRGLENQDPKLMRSILCALSAIASHRSELAEAVVAGGYLRHALLHAGHNVAPVRRAAACLIRDIVKHSVGLAELVVNNGGCEPLVKLLAETTGGTRVPACTALGYIAGQSDQLAMAVIESKAIIPLVTILQSTDVADSKLCAAAWTIGQIAKHSPQHSLSVAVALPRLLQILPGDPHARRSFVTTGALKRVQEIVSAPGTSLNNYINFVNSCFPEEVVRFNTPGYSHTLLDMVEAYNPQIPELSTDRLSSDCETKMED